MPFIKDKDGNLIFTENNIDRYAQYPNTLKVDLNKYEPYIGGESEYIKGTYDQNKWDEERAQNQGSFEKFYRSVGQGLGTFGTAVGSTAGVLLGLPYAAIHAWEDGDQSQLDDITANPIVKGFSQLDKYIKEDLLPTYYTKEQQNSLLSAATGTDLVNGVGFLLSNLVPTGLVTKGFGTIANGLTKSKLGILASELDDAIKLGKISVEEAGKYSGLIKGLEKTGDITGAILGRVGETAIEANDAEEKIIQNLTQKREEARQKLMLGETPDNPEDANLTDDQISQLAKEQRNNVFGANMLLAVSDFIQAGRWFGKNPLLKDIQKQGLKYAVAERGKGELLKDFFKEALQESGEEGFQFLAQKGAENAAQNKDFLGEFSNATGDLFTTIEGQKSMLLGALLGGGAGAAFSALNGKERKDRLNALVDNLNANPDIKDRYIINAEGKRVINPEFANSTEKFVMYEAAKQAAKETNDQDSYDLAEKLQFADLVSSRHQAGRLNDLIDEIKSIGNMSPKEVEDFFGEAPLNPITNEKMTPSEIASQKIEEARSIAKAIDGLSQMKEFANLSAAGKSHIANKLVHQDVLKKQYVDLNKKISEIKPSDIQVSAPSIAPIETALNENPTEGKNPLEMNPEVISQPVKTKETYSALDQAKLDDLNRKKQIIEKQYAAINEELKGYAKDPKAADIVAEDEEIKQVDKEVEKQQKQLIVKNKLAKYESDIAQKAQEENTIPEEYKLMSAYNEPLFIAKNAKGETILRNNVGKDVTYRLANENFTVAHISEEPEIEEIEDEAATEETPWEFQKTTILTSAGRNSTAAGTYNSRGDRENLFLSPGRQLFYKQIRNTNGKLSLKLEIAPPGMYSELFIDDQGNPINEEDIDPRTLPVIVGYLYRNGDPVIIDGIRAYNVIHHHESGHQFAAANAPEQLAQLEELRNQVLINKGLNENSFVDITEISKGFLNLTEEPRPLSDKVLDLPFVKKGGVTIKVSVISPVTKKPVIVENGKEVTNVKWSGRPYLRVHTGVDVNGNPIYSYQELGTRNLNDSEIQNIIVPLISEYVNGKDKIESGDNSAVILSYDKGTPSVLDSFITFGRTGSYKTSIFFGRGGDSRVLSFGFNEETGTKYVLNKNNFNEMAPILMEFLQGKKRAISRKYTDGAINMAQNLFIPVFTGQGVVFEELSYLDLISGKNEAFEPALSTRLSDSDVLLNQYVVFDPEIHATPNKTVGVKNRQSQKPVKNTDDDTDIEEVALTKPINQLQYYALSTAEQEIYKENMAKINGPKFGNPVEGFEDFMKSYKKYLISQTNENTPGKTMTFLDFAKKNLTEAKYNQFLKYLNPSTFAAKPKTKESKTEVKTTLKFLNEDDTVLKVGSLVELNNKKYVVYAFGENNLAQLRSLENDKIVIDQVGNTLTVKGSYPVVVYKKAKFIVTNSKRIVSAKTGQDAYNASDAENKKAKTKKGKASKPTPRQSIYKEAKKQIEALKEQKEKIYVETEVEEEIEVTPNFDATLDDAIPEIAEAAELNKSEEVEEKQEEKIVEEQKSSSPFTESPFGSDDIDARQNAGLPYKVGDVNSASNWLQKTLGITPSIAEGIIRVAGFDNGLFGYFYQGAITLSDILEEGTEYHEAYHLVSRMYLTPSQRQSLYNEVRKREGKELTDKQAEEILAEDFREYVMTDGKIVYPEVQKNIFQKLLDFVKWIFGVKPLTVNEVFNKINQGYYNQKKYIQKINNDKTDMFGRDAAHIFSPSAVFKLDSDLFSIFSTYLAIQKIKIYDISDRDIMDDFSKYCIERFATLESIFNADPQYFLKRFKENLLLKPEFDFESELPEETRGKNEGNEYQEANRLSAFNNISDNMEILMSIIQDVTTPKDPETNQYKPIPKSEVKAFMADSLHDIFTYQEMIEKLKAKRINLKSEIASERRNAGIAQQILFHLNDTDTGFKSTMFKAQFQEAFTLVKQAMLTSIYFNPSSKSNGNVAVVNSIEAVIQKRIKDYWQNSVMRSNLITNQNGVRFITDANWQKLLSAEPTEFFNQLGIDFRAEQTTDVLNLIRLLKNKLNNLPLKTVKLTENNKEVEKLVRTPILFAIDPYYDEIVNNLDESAKKSLRVTIAGIKDTIKNLSEIELPYYNATVEAQSRNTEGETVHAYSKPSFIFQQIKRIKDGLTKYNTVKNSVLWEAIENNAIDVSLIDGSKYSGQGEEGIHISTFTEENMLLNKLINLYNDAYNGTIQFLQMADKKSVPGLTVNKKTASNLIYSPSEINVVKNDKGVPEIKLSAQNRAVKRLWDIYKNYKEFDNNEELYKKYKTYGKAAALFEDVNKGKLYENIDQFAKAVSLMMTQGLLDVMPMAANFVGKDANDKVRSVVPENILELSNKDTIQDRIQQILAATVTTEFVNNLDQMNVFFGNPVFYKDLFKRTPEVRANGRVPSVDNYMNEFIVEFRKRYNITEEQKNAMPIDGTYKAITGEDPKVSSKYAEEYEKILGKDAYGKNQINPTDGQGLATFEFYLEYGIRTGQLDIKNFEKAVESELNGIPSNYPFPPLKLVHYGKETDSDEFVPVFYKFSVYPLLPTMIKGRNLEKINKKLLDSGAGLYVFNSGVKDGNTNVLDTLSNDTVDPASMHHLNLQDLKTQVDINPKYDKFTLLLGTQIRKLINQNSADAGKDVKNKELVDSYEQTVKDLIQLEAESLADSLGEDLTSLQSGIISRSSWSKLVDMFKESAIEREESDNLIIGLDYLKQEDLTIDVLPNRNKVQNLMNAFINNKILKQNMRGRAYVQCSSVGFEYTTEKDLEAAVKKGIVLKDSEFYRSHFVDGKFDNTEARLGFVHVKEDKIVTAEILLPYYFKEAGFDINNIDPKLLEALGYRIPTQGLNSMLAFKVVGFLPKSTDQLVAVPYEITMQSGSDFDVDKLNTFLRNYILKNKELKPLSEEKEITYSKLLTDLIDKRDRLVLEDYTLEELEDLEIETLEDINTEGLDKKIEKLKEKETKKFKKLKLQEQLFDIMYQKLTDPSMMFDYINPNSAENLENQAKEINQIQTEPYKKTTQYKGYRQFLTSTNIKVGKNFWSAKAGVGQAASQGVFTALTQLYPIVQEKYSDRVFVPKDQIILENDKIVFGKINNAAGKSIIDLIANQHLSANVDAASKPFIFQLNANLITNDTHYYLIAATVPDTWVNKFLTQPIIIDYVNEMEKNKGIVAKKRRSLFNEYRKESDIVTKLFAKYGASYQPSEYLNADLDPDGLRVPSASDENRRYTEDDLMKFMKKPGKEQANILDDFLFYKQFASQRRDQIASIKFDTEGSGKNLPESRIIDFKYNKVSERKLFSGLETLVEKSFLSGFKKNVLDLTLNMYAGSTIVERTSEARGALTTIMEKLFAINQLKPENMYKIYGVLTNTILQNNLIPKNKPQWWQVNMLSKESIAARTSKFIASPETKDNYLFQNLLTIDYALTQNEPDIIRIDNTVRIDNDLQKVIYQSFKDFGAFYPALYEDIIKASLFQTGVIESPVSFYKYIPVDDFVNVVGPLVKKQSQINILEFLSEIYQNLPTLRGLVQSVRYNDIIGDKAGLPEKFEVPGSINYDVDFLLKKSKNKVGLYEKKGKNKDNFVFQKIPIKSNLKFYNTLINNNIAIENIEDDTIDIDYVEVMPEVKGLPAAKVTQQQNSVKPKIDLSREWKGDLESRPVYTAKGVNTMRTSAAKPTEHFGNPFSEAGYGNTIKVDSIDDAATAYKDWLLHGVTLVKTTNKVNLDTYLKPFEAQRVWILDQINQGKLDGANLLYSKKLMDRGQGSHAISLAEVVEQLRGQQQSSRSNSETKTPTSSYAISKIKLSDGKEYNVKDITEEMLIDLKYSQEDAMEIINKFCKQL